MVWGVFPTIYGWDGAESGDLAYSPGDGLLSRLRRWLRPDPSRSPCRPRRQARRDGVTIIITARNYARFARDAVASAIANKPDRLIYVDDCSDPDDARRLQQVLAEFPAVELVRAPKRLGAAGARNVGLDLVQTEYVIFQDGDDQLPTGYVRQTVDCHRSRKRPIPYVYTSAQAFGYRADHWRVSAEFDWPKLLNRNYVHTTACYRTEAVRLAGGWTDVAGTSWDWSLAMRAARAWHRLYGVWPAGLPDVHILYRQHADSWSHAPDRPELCQGVATWNGERYDEVRGRIRAAELSKAVGVVYSGRLNNFEKVLEGVERSVRAAGQDPGDWDLIVVNNSAERSPTIDCGFGSVSLVKGSPVVAYATERQRQDAVAELLARSYNAILARTNADVLWLVEDDIRLPIDACKRLLAELCEWNSDSGKPAHAAVSASYRGRHGNRRDLIAYRLDPRSDWDDWSPATLRRYARVDAPTKVDLIGTGCVMFFRELCPHFGSHVVNASQRSPAHDWEWSSRIRRGGGHILLSPLRVEHQINEREVV